MEEEEEEGLEDAMDNLLATTMQNKDILRAIIRTQCIHPVSIAYSLIM